MHSFVQPFIHACVHVFISCPVFPLGRVEVNKIGSGVRLPQFAHNPYVTLGNLLYLYTSVFSSVKGAQ